MIKGGGSGFNALPGGYRNPDGSFLNLGDYGHYWSATEFGSGNAWDYYFYRDDGKLYRNGSSKAFGFPCRCVQDIGSLPL